MNATFSKIMSGVAQTALWSLRRVDYYINGSLVTLNNPDHYDNPYLAYNTLRERGPILRSAANRGWIITGYNEISELLRDRRISSDIRKNTFFVRLLKFAASGIEFPLLENPSMLNQDPPDHTRLRKLVASGFMHKYIQSLAPKIEQLVDELLDKIPADAESFDIIETLANPLPAIVIAEMMGVPEEDRHYFVQWSEALIGLTEISNPEAINKAAVANREMYAYIEGLTDKKRGERHSEKNSQQDQDLISLLVAAEEDGDKLSRDELYSSCVLLLTAGHETTTRLIGNCLYLLLNHPEQMQSARESESLLMAAFEEALRLEPPVQLTARFVNQDLTFKGHQFKRGQMLLLSIAGANRDPIANQHPNDFDISREDIKHLSFGYGIHLCLGMALARLEAKIAFTKLFERYPQLEQAKGKPNWGTNDFFRGLSALPLNTSQTSAEEIKLPE